MQGFVCKRLWGKTVATLNMFFIRQFSSLWGLILYQMSNVFVIIKMCYVHNQWYDILCATLYINYLKKEDSLHKAQKQYGKPTCQPLWSNPNLLEPVIKTLLYSPFHWTRYIFTTVQMLLYVRNGDYNGHKITRWWKDKIIHLFQLWLPKPCRYIGKLYSHSFLTSPLDGGVFNSMP